MTRIGSGRSAVATRTTGRERAYDLILNGDGYILAQDKGVPIWTEDSIPTELGQDAPMGERNVEMRTFHLGYGYGEHYVPGCYDYAVDADCSQPGMIVAAGLLTTITGVADGSNLVTDFFELGGNIYAIGGRYCRQINTTTDALVALGAAVTGKDFGASTVVTKAVEFDGAIFVGFSSSTPIWKFTGSAWSQAATVQAKYFAKDWLDVPGAVGWRLWRGYSTNSVDGVLTGSDPLTAANWGPATPFAIGDTSQALTGLVGMRHAVWACKADGLYGLDSSGRATNLLQAIAHLKSANNGVNPIAIDDYICLPHIMGLLEFNPRTAGSNLQSIQPGGDPGNTSPVYGRVTAQTYLAGWHYVAIYNGTDTYILKGRRPHEGEAIPPGWIGPKIWHPLVKIPAKTVNCMHVSGLTTPNRLWMGAGQDVAYITVSPINNPLSESGHTYAAAPSIYLSPIDFGARGIDKELMGFDIENSGFSSSTFAQLKLSIDAGAYTQWGLSATTASRTRLSRPATGSWRGYNTKMRLDITNASSASTPKVKGLIARAALRPQYEDVLSFSIILADAQKTADGRSSRVAADTALGTLKALRNSPPVVLTDYWKGDARSRNVVVEKAGPMRLIEQHEFAPPAWISEVTVRVIGNVGTYFNWDGQADWSGNYKWT